jgi:hypothetical protein
LLAALLTASAIAGRLGPSEDGPAVAEALHPLSACDDVYPFDLVQLPASDFWVEFRPEHAWGTPTMVQVLEEAAQRLTLQHPGSPPLLVGDIAQQHGGNLPPHKTHGDGRSADIGLFGWSGTVDGLHGGFPKLRPDELDVERTWAVIEALLATGQVEHILLDQGHIDRIVTWLRETGRKSPAELARTFPPLDSPRLWSMTSIVRHAEDHAEHLHVRVLCAGPGHFSGT